MRFYVGITDDDWFAYLAARSDLDEVNFWQPTASRAFRSLEPGEPFLFKLHSPRNYIVGGGFFSLYTALPVSFAWEAFTTKNGAKSEQEMRARIARYRRGASAAPLDYRIGCIILQSPFFFRDDDWIPASDWEPAIVQGRGYDTTDERGRAIWLQVEDRLKFARAPSLSPSASGLAEEVRYGAAQLVLSRLGQGSFRVFVTEAYGRRCAVTHSPVLHVLEAAHIRPVADKGPNATPNGILLRQDVHTLFDRGYITVTPRYRVEVSRLIKQEFDNGQEYYSLHGSSIFLPTEEVNRPSPELLMWHNDNVYRG
jgi:HNH endonuclease